ncbi:hypothetical protein ALC53_03806 [Atta colombica]|uniref:Uncharacterized protein n=1 Tax=Atta colombica TaxID=520822 RepID=A0A195BNS4_9HYME|nr:hypothetical protein ALC53_03806 [Atta colombica]
MLGFSIFRRSERIDLKSSFISQILLRLSKVHYTEPEPRPAGAENLTLFAKLLESADAAFKDGIYYVWNVIERVTNKSRCSNVTLLRTVIEAAFGMDSATLQRACFRSRIEAVIQTNGGCIE